MDILDSWGDLGKVANHRWSYIIKTNISNVGMQAYSFYHCLSEFRPSADKWRRKAINEASYPAGNGFTFLKRLLGLIQICIDRQRELKTLSFRRRKKYERCLEAGSQRASGGAWLWRVFGERGCQPRGSFVRGSWESDCQTWGAWKSYFVKLGVLGKEIVKHWVRLCMVLGKEVIKLEVRLWGALG